jgi:hypothetical protein
MGTRVLEPGFPYQKMKAILCLLSLAGLLITTGCEIEEHEHGGYYGPQEYQYGYYHHGYWDHDHGGYWDRGRYYYY